MSQTATAFRVGIIMAAEKIALVEAAAFADREHGPWPLTFHSGKNWSSWTKLGRWWTRGRRWWTYSWASPTPPESDIKSR